MKDSNPFSPTRTLADPAVMDAVKKTGVLNVEIMNNTLRGIFAFLCFGVAPIYITRTLNLVSLFDEFGIQLPWMTQFVLQFCGQVCRVPWLYLPLCLGGFTGIEFGIYSISSSFWKTLVNVVYWLVFILLLGVVCFSLVLPLIAITSGLTGSINLCPLLCI